MSDFPTALSFVLAREGGRVDNLADPGGRTNLGITQKTWDAWRAAGHVGPVDVWDITVADAAPVYQAEYWKAAGCDSLDDGPALAVFDTAVNLGVARAVALWQAAAGDVEEFLWSRLAWYDSLSHLHTFVAGWLHRVLLLREAVHQGGV